ncbi:MAG: hypothetical protein IMZ46_10865, partial [Acidobacteria bacterium]|nr:hypothetical protein [Acidobacteriota bacterium]
MIICAGPRSVINAATLYAVYDADLANKEATSIDRTFMGFFENIQQLANEDYQQVVILSAMAFTLIIWAFSALFLILAILFYVLFLWHWIPRADGGLGGYCERKVTESLVKVVTKKVNKALERQQTSLMKTDYKAGKGSEKPMMNRQATLPTIPDLGPGMDGDKLPAMPTMQRSDTFSTLPPYTSKPGTPGSIELNAFDQKRPVPSRAGTSASTSTAYYSTRAGLVNNASDMAVTSPLSPAPSLPSVDFNRYGSPAPSPGPQRGFSRTGTQASNPSLRHQPSTTSSSYGGGRYTETPSNYNEMPYPAPSRSPSARPDGYGNLPPIPQGSALSSRSGTPRMEPFPADGRDSPASMYSARSGGPPRAGFQAYQPSRSATGPAPLRHPQQQQPARNNTTGDYFSQPGQGQGSAFEYDHD